MGRKRENEIINNFISWLEKGDRRYKTISLKEENEIVEMSKLQKSLSKTMEEYVKKYGN